MNNTASPVRSCGCGCGASVVGRFRQGHDAKLKGNLLGATRSNDWWVRESAANQLVELGWGHFVDSRVLATTPVRSRYQGRYVRTRNLDNPNQYTCTDADGTTHSSRACPTVQGDCTDGNHGWACNVCTHYGDLADVARFHV